MGRDRSPVTKTETARTRRSHLLVHEADGIHHFQHFGRHEDQHAVMTIRGRAACMQAYALLMAACSRPNQQARRRCSFASAVTGGAMPRHVFDPLPHSSRQPISLFASLLASLHDDALLFSLLLSRRAGSMQRCSPSNVCTSSAPRGIFLCFLSSKMMLIMSTDDTNQSCVATCRIGMHGRERALFLRRRSMPVRSFDTLTKREKRKEVASDTIRYRHAWSYQCSTVVFARASHAISSMSIQNHLASACRAGRLHPYMHCMEMHQHKVL